MNIPNVILFKDLIKQFPDHNEPSILEGETFCLHFQMGNLHVPEFVNVFT